MNCWIIEHILTSPKAIASQISSARVINTFDIIHDIKDPARERKCCKTEEALPKEEGDIVREYKAMHEKTRLIDTKSLLQVTHFHGDKASFLG